MSDTPSIEALEIVEKHITKEHSETPWRIHHVLARAIDALIKQKEWAAYKHGWKEGNDYAFPGEE